MNDDLVPNEHLNGFSAKATGAQTATDELAESLRQLLREAILMLAYSRRQGISIPDAEITTVVAFNDLFAKGQVPESETRVQFLQSYDHIAKLIRPATISSLQAVLGNDGLRRDRTVADKEIRRYTGFAIIAFVVLATAQVLWIIGGGLSKDLADARTAFETASLEFAPYEPLTHALAPGQQPVQMSPEQRAEEQKLETKVSRSLSSIRGYDSSLSEWNQVLSQASRLLRPFLKNPTPPVSKAEPYLFVMPPDEQQRIASDATTATFGLQTLQIFALPFLYGLLGASIYILRRLSRDIRTLAYEPVNDYRLRIPMGALSGVAIGLIFNVEDAGNLGKSISAFALAFLAGYSVEFLFSVIDRLVGAFSKDPAEATK